MPVTVQDDQVIRENRDLKETPGLQDSREKPTATFGLRVRDDNIFKPDVNNVNYKEEFMFLRFWFLLCIQRSSWSKRSTWSTWSTWCTWCTLPCLLSR